METQRKKFSPSVLVIGAGIAGLSAAKQLRQHGFTNVQILEANNRIGGRIFTTPFGKSSENFVEMGANWIHGASVQNPLFTAAIEKEHLKSDGLELIVRKVGLFYTSDGRIVDPELAFKAFDMFMNADQEAHRTNEIKDLPLKEFLDRRLGKHLDDAPSNEWREDAQRVFNCMHNYLTFHVGDTLDKAGLNAYGEYKTILGGDAKLPTGFSAILKSCFADSSPQSSVKLGMLVDKIYWSDPETVTAECRDGTIFEADHVILTLPLGYLKRRQSSIFAPPLPTRKQNAIADLNFGRVDKIFLYYSEPFWHSGMQSIHLAWARDELDRKDWVQYIFGFDEVLNNRNVLVAWISGDGAEMMEKLDEEQIACDCTEVLRKFTANPSIPLPARVLRTRWCGDELTYGSYTYLPVGYATKAIEDLAASLPSLSNPRVLFAGEATHAKYFSTAHGAMMTGIREADRLISFYQTKSSKL